MGILHLAVSVFALIWKTPHLLKLKKTISLLSWLDSKWAHLVHYEEIFDFELELLTFLWQALLGIHYSVMVHNYSVTQYGGQTISLTAHLCSHLLGHA